MNNNQNNRYNQNTTRQNPARQTRPNQNGRPTENQNRVRTSVQQSQQAQNRPAVSKQYNNRRPSQKRKNNGFSKFVLIMVILISIGIIFLFARSIRVGNGGDMQNKDTGTTENKQTEEKTEDITDEKTEATTEEQSQKPFEEEYVPEFKADLSNYEIYMNPQGVNRDAYLVLVNPSNPLTANDVPKDLVDVKSTRQDGRKTQQLREYAAKALEALMLEAEACGMVTTNTPSGKPLSVMSAYRTYEYQDQLFNTYVSQEMSNKGLSRAEAEKIVETYSCRAGTSEHQTALCVDMHTLPSANVAFKDEKEAKWLAENCYKFGFILRFPENKTDITGITYEPWHFRYVGRYHAKKMYDLNMCLEEYVKYIKQS